MSEISNPDRINLVVNTSDPCAEIFLMDQGLQFVDRGMGKLQSKQPPGIYKLKVRLADGFLEQLVTLERDPVQLDLGRVKFHSPVPLPMTSGSDDRHMKTAVDISRLPAARIGSGSSILVFCRPWAWGGEVRQKAGDTHPLAGMSLVDAQEKVYPLEEYGDRIEVSRWRKGSDC